MTEGSMHSPNSSVSRVVRSFWLSLFELAMPGHYSNTVKQELVAQLAYTDQ